MANRIWPAASFCMTCEIIIFFFIFKWLHFKWLYKFLPNIFHFAFWPTNPKYLLSNPSRKSLPTPSLGNDVTGISPDFDYNKYSYPFVPLF